MARVVGPLFSLEAHGSIDDCLTYETFRSLTICKALRFPTYSRTDLQGYVRDILCWAAYIWHFLADEKKQKWIDAIDYLGLNGYQSFMSFFLKRTYLNQWQYELPGYIGFCITGNHNVNEFVVGGGFMSP